jgi:hypothetical protein
MSCRILLFVLLLFAVSCISVEICDDSYDSVVNVKFKSVHEGVTADSTIASLTLYGIREGLPDSLIYDAKPASGFTAPLDPGHNPTSFVMQVNGQTDTILIYHQQEIYLISYTCGFANRFTLEHLESRIGIISGDSILKETVDAEYDSNEEHIWIYF